MSSLAATAFAEIRQARGPSRMVRYTSPADTGVKLDPTPAETAEMDFAAQQVGQFAADGEAEAGAAIFAARAGIGPGGNASKMIFCFSIGMPMPLSETSKAITLGDCLSTGCSGPQPLLAAYTFETDAAALGELEGVGQQVLQDLLQTLGVGRDGAADQRIDLRLKRQLPCFGFVSEWPRATISTRFVNRISSASTVTVPDSILERSRMSLMRFKRSVAGTVDGARKLHLLRRQVRVRIFRRAAGRESEYCSGACAAHATCWPETLICISMSAQAPSLFSSSARRAPSIS